jgi:hypothetical protein
VHPAWRGPIIAVSVSFSAQCTGSALSNDSVVVETTVETTVAPTLTATNVDAGGTIAWSAPADAFVIGALPRGFRPHGDATVVDATASPTRVAQVSQTFINQALPAQLVISVDTGPPAVTLLTSSGMTPRTDVLAGTDLYVWIDPTTRQLGTAWQARDSVVWLYGTNVPEDMMLDIARSIHLAAT